MAAKLDYNQIMVDASNRLHAIINACINKDNDSIICNTCSSMYSCEKYIPTVEEEKEQEQEQPILDQYLWFKYKGYDFELTSCNNITCKDQIIGVTDENFRERFPHGIFTDRYVCWMYGHKDIEGYTKEELNDMENWAANIYLIPDFWYWGAESDLKPGLKVDRYILETIDKFLETFKE